MAGITSNHAVFQILESRFSFPQLIDTLFSNLDENKVFFLQVCFYGCLFDACALTYKERLQHYMQKWSKEEFVDFMIQLNQTYKWDW